jgi:alanine racemase
MTLTLYVDRAAWKANVRDGVNTYGDVLAVVKGNGYGFGLTRLAARAVDLGLRRLAVGTVHELAALPPLDEPPLVLTPLGRADAGLIGGAMATVGSLADVEVLAGAAVHPPVTVKLASSMQRYGVNAADLATLLTAIERTGLDVRGYAIHLPLAGNVAEVDRWLRVLPVDAPISVSHLPADVIDGLRSRHPSRAITARLGGALWHGDKSSLSLRADVIETRPVRAGDRVGYRLVEVPGDGTLVMIGAGTAHGVHPLPDGRSPFHFARHRLSLVEPPHMHTAMAFVPAVDPTPGIGDDVDVQQPLTFVLIDRIVER